MRFEDRYFEDYEVGETRTTTGRTITESDIVTHAGQTGDFFPHHMDKEWAATQPFKKRIAHGTLAMSIAVGQTAGDINPQSMSYGYDRVRFIAPVFIDDTITVTAEITAKRDHHKRPDEYGFVDELVSVVNQDGQTVLVLTHIYLVNKRAAG
ncbi:MaoC family dehydratase [Microbacterium gubbeenense]|uniref:MaoC family dehydratase n=1 Tax=Microbacterium gubbeenense TaxID=159896 RepID=UPI003F9E4659